MNLSVYNGSLIGKQCIKSGAAAHGPDGSTLLLPLDNDDFISIIEQLIPDVAVDESSPYDSAFSENALAIIFACLGASSVASKDSGSDSSETYRNCNAAELIAGLSILCTGDKSEKLAFVFDAFDENSSGSLSESMCSVCAFLFVSYPWPHHWFEKCCRRRFSPSCLLLHPGVQLFSSLRKYSDYLNCVATNPLNLTFCGLVHRFRV